MSKVMMLAALILAVFVSMAEEGAAIPATRIVYADRLVRGMTGEPLAFDSGTTYDMTLKVYETEDAIEPKGTYVSPRVAVGRDGSFTAVFGDQTLTELCATGRVQFVGLTIGSGNELKPRRELRPVANVTHALVADQPAGDIRMTSLLSEGAIQASKVEIDSLSVKGTVSVAGPSKVRVAPTRLLEGASVTVRRGKGVKVFSHEDPTCVSVRAPIDRNQFLATAPFSGLAVITSMSEDPELKIPAVTLFCREGEAIHSPSAVSAGGVTVKFLKFAR